ncbi:TetR/AcrR family transcriptional regulator [Actinomadura sp. DC4]|uniref:TetR/AcrR family transcriptional regulator n=1 Tax=Actinomadura sp. DC4 TaxID=3055069 RepID=UPI0025AEF1E1|nr:TetR/AcrR family transcriptional regulator [Actinomadura sp. DC4]MDN3351513.1 TetR/AcrR family transcriptional regulator [Actinomadura sp. DC4]
MSATTNGGGRGARERILRAATRLFYDQGITATGIGELTEVAHVSKRTLYQHFESKDVLVAAYLGRFADESLLAREQILARTDLPARDRLLGLFDDLEVTGEGALRGCPYLNAAAEIADPAHPARRLAVEHKRAFRELLRATAEEAGAADPGRLADQLAVLFDGALAQSALLNDRAPLRHARAAAETLLSEGRGHASSGA